MHNVLFWQATVKKNFEYWLSTLQWYVVLLQAKIKKKQLFNMDFYIVIWNVFIEGNLQKALFIPWWLGIW